VSPNGHNKPTVIIVDDEEMIVTSLRALLEMYTDYNIQTFTDADQAARFAASQPVDVIISDYLMPKMNGISLLSRLKELQPEASRILLTGNADKQSAIQSINQIALFQYLEKPWDNAQLLLVIRSAAERTRLLRDLQEKIQDLDAAHSVLKNTQKRLIQAFL
jgi:response regulator RpfG family c-di-GMP phosphodiesterase